jgi:hypothetical protein
MDEVLENDKRAPFERTLAINGLKPVVWRISGNAA